MEDYKDQNSLMDLGNSNLEEKAMIGMAANLAEINPATDYQEPAEEGAAMIDPPHEPMEYRFLYIMMFVLMSLNDGLIVGYNSYLVADFTEREVPSKLRALLYVVTFVYFFRMFIGPVTDKFYLPYVGKRKTYLIPCKLIATVIYFSMSFKIDSLVENKEVVKIALFFFFLSWIMVFENNSMAGFRVDFFGKNESSAAGASATISLIGGITLGLQVFNALSSDQICKKYLGLSGKVMNHASLFRFIAVINVIGLVMMLLVKEKGSLNSALVASSSGNPLKVIRALFGVRRLGNVIIANIIWPTFSVGLKVAISQYYWKKKLNKDLHILSIGLVMVPMTVLSNIVWLQITKRGRLMYLMWIAVLLAVLVESLHIFNYRNFKPGENDRQTIVIICLLTAGDALGNWLMVQGSYLMKAAPSNYAITFISTINSLVSVFRIFPMAIMTSMIDYVAFEWIIASSLILQIAINLSTYSMANDIDKEDPSDIGKQFAVRLENS